MRRGEKYTRYDISRFNTPPSRSVGHGWALHPLATRASRREGREDLVDGLGYGLHGLLGGVIGRGSVCEGPSGKVEAKHPRVIGADIMTTGTAIGHGGEFEQPLQIPFGLFFRQWQSGQAISP